LAPSFSIDFRGAVFVSFAATKGWSNKRAADFEVLGSGANVDDGKELGSVPRQLFSELNAKVVNRSRNRRATTNPAPGTLIVANQLPVSVSNGKS
jgi:hypothetical protein